MNLGSFLLLFTMLILSSCGAQQHLSEQHAKPQPPLSGHAAGSNPDGSNSTASQQGVPSAAAKQSLSTANMSPAFLYLAAQKALKEGNHALAIELLSALLQKDPGAIDPRLQLTMLLLASGQPDRASAHMDALLASKKLTAHQQEQLQLARIRLFLVQGQVDQALHGVERFLKNHPAHIQGRDIQVRILSSRQRYDAALAAIAAAIRVKERPEFRLLQAQLLIKTGNITAARRSLARMQTLAPDHEMPVLLLSALAMKEKHVAQAEQLLRDFIAAHPESLNVHLALGKLLIQQHRLPDAIMVYRELARLSGNNPGMLRQLGMLYFEHNDYAGAEKTFRQLLASRPDDMSRFYLAASLEAQGKADQASALYEQIDTSSALAAEAQLRLAAIDVSHDKFDKASQRLQKILKNNPAYLDAHLMQSAIWLSQKKFRKLIDATASLMSLKKLPPQLLFNRAVAFEHFKQYEQTEAMLNRVIRLNPDNAEALNFLGYTYAVQGIKLDRAKALIQRALIQKPGDGYYLDSLAWAYYRSGDYDKAAEMQSKALKQIPDDAVMHEHYGDIMWKKGRPQVARQAWKKAIELKSEHPQQLQQKIQSGLKSTQ